MNEDVLRRARVKFDELFARTAPARPAAQQGTQPVKTGGKSAGKSGGKTKAAEAPRETQPPTKKVCAVCRLSCHLCCNTALSGKRQRQRFWMEQHAMLQLRWLRPHGCKLQQAQEGCLRGCLRILLAGCSLPALVVRTWGLHHMSLALLLGIKKRRTADASKSKVVQQMRGRPLASGTPLLSVPCIAGCLARLALLLPGGQQLMGRWGSCTGRWQSQFGCCVPMPARVTCICNMPGITI